MKQLLVTIVFVTVFSYCIAGLPFQPKPLLRSAYGEFVSLDVNPSNKTDIIRGKVYIDAKNERFSQQFRFDSSKYCSVWLYH
jgi:hypothetical protein